MKNAPAKPKTKDVLYGGSKSGHEDATVHDREGRISVRGVKSIAKKATSPAMPSAIAYDAEDIEEANRLGAALCRQHAR